MTTGLSFIDTPKRATEHTHPNPIESYMPETPVVDF
jgi:hypothetical protein